jgi:uncharacterized membrane protein YfcA
MMKMLKRNSPLRQYLADTGRPASAYFASVIVAALLAKQIDPGWLRTMVALLPLPSILWMARAELARLRRRDELRQRIELETMTIAFSVSFCLMAMLTFLDMFGAFKATIATAFMLMAVSWIGAQLWVRMRYRYWWGESEQDEET